MTVSIWIHKFPTAWEIQVVTSWAEIAEGLGPEKFLSTLLERRDIQINSVTSHFNINISGDSLDDLKEQPYERA